MIAKLPPLNDVLNLLPDAVCVVDVDGHLLFVNTSFERIFGYAPHEVLGRQIFDMLHPDDREATMRNVEQVMAGTSQPHFRNRYVHKQGHSVDIQWAAHWLPDHGVRIGVGREVTDLRRAERELEYRANHDPLTGLANRQRLASELQYAIARAAQTGDGLALLYLDLDGFKSVNDRGGHDAGDHVLREVAQRLHQCLRQGDLVARVGGDEFVAMLTGSLDITAARAVADDIRARLQSPFTLPAGSFRLDASIGIACYPADGDDPEILLTHADRAMYERKQHKR
jgi:diguanylate cyclase (GGDEF)-like protein/PAS domain S-box-containing protein